MHLCVTRYLHCSGHCRSIPDDLASLTQRSTKANEMIPAESPAKISDFAQPGGKPAFP
ncbi:UNVERIFIED_CONTAM: hypothetical protein FKN15_065848 [Acipenser sinensis]